MGCQFCGREINNKGSLRSHELSCKSNPERVKHPRSPKAGWPKGKQGWNKGLKTGPRVDRFPLEVILVENSTYARTNLKRRIREHNLIPYECQLCGLGPEWMGKPMPLILDHINGVNNDNRLENLRFVCSNCDTQLPTYKSKNRRMGARAA